MKCFLSLAAHQNHQKNGLEKNLCLKSDIIRHKARKSVVCHKLPMVTDGENVLIGIRSRFSPTFLIANSISGHLKFSENCLYHYLGKFQVRKIYSILTILYLAFITDFLTNHQSPISGCSSISIPSRLR